METLSTQITQNNSDDVDGAHSADTQIFSPSKTQMGADISLPESQIGTDNTDRLKKNGLE